MTVDASSHIVARGYRQERSRVVVEPDSVVKASTLCGVLTEAQHAFGAVMEPPGWAQLQHRVVTGQRRKLSAVCRFIEREHDHAQVALVTQAIQQWFQRAN